jgi:hypothetical protein
LTITEYASRFALAGKVAESNATGFLAHPAYELTVFPKRYFCTNSPQSDALPGLTLGQPRGRQRREVSKARIAANGLSIIKQCDGLTV